MPLESPFRWTMRAAAFSQLDFNCMGDYNFDLYDLHAINLNWFQMIYFPLLGTCGPDTYL